jgi:CO/xanthine dehydrogenase Mo-binding subunit
MTAYMGKVVKRIEDRPLMTGRGTFVDDLTFPDMLHAAVLRSPHAHARILSIDVSAARDMAGVVTVLIDRDLQGVVGDVPVVERQGADYANTPGHPALAEEKVFYVGQPVAVVVAQDGYRARDALDKVVAKYDPVPAIVDPHQAVQQDTPPLHTQMLTNTAMCVRTGRGDVQAAFAQADHIIRGRFVIPRLPAGMQAGLEFPVKYTLPDNPYAFAAHVAVIEVDGETGEVRILRYIAVHDSGPLINPMLARGQIHGGIAQGIGQALSEAILYSDDGQPLNRSLMDYAVPRMAGVPTVIVDTLETPSSTNPLGIKGVGELPTVASPVAMANAVLDALAATPVDHIDIPLSPEKLWLALRKAEG